MQINPADGHKRPIHLLITYKDFGRISGISHIGLGVSAINIAKCLVANGIRAEVFPVLTVEALEKKIEENPSITHVVIAAIWISTANLARLTRKYTQITFAINCHSNIGFLQAEPNAIKLIREGLDLEQGTHNFHVGANSNRLCAFIRDAYQLQATYLPNLYFLDDLAKNHIPLWDGGLLRVGIFGAQRAQKNITSAVAAGIEIAHATKAQTEIWINAGRTDGGGNVVQNAAKALTDNVPGVTLKLYPWASWPEFRRFVRSMHLLLQPSYTETFNVTTADGVAEGVPSVVSSAIEWAPPHWKADVDNVLDIAQVGRRLLHDPCAARDGLRHLLNHNEHGIRIWREYLRETLLP